MGHQKLEPLCFPFFSLPLKDENIPSFKDAFDFSASIFFSLSLFLYFFHHYFFVFPFGGGGGGAPGNCFLIILGEEGRTGKQGGG